MTAETEPNESTKDAERTEAAQAHVPDRPATDEEAEAAERGKAAISDADQKAVAEHFEEMAERGAHVKGEGEIR